MLMGRIFWISAAALGAVGAIAAAVWLSGGATYSNAGVRLKPDDGEIVMRGKSIYAQHCASCHGAKLQGEAPDWRRRNAEGLLPAPPHDATGHTWHHSDRVLFNLTKHGLSAVAGQQIPSNMPAYKDVLSDEEIIAVLSFIKAQWPPEIREHHDSLNKARKR